MAQDLRKLFKDQPTTNEDVKMNEGHEARFLQKLDDTLPQKKTTSRFGFLNIAASIVIVLGLSFGIVRIMDNSSSGGSVSGGGNVPETAQQMTTLGDLSPDLKKVEDYYLASINLELSKIQLTPENKELFDGYITRLEELNKEYEKLTLELTENGANELTIEALINNLKLRLNLLYRLKEQLKEFNTDNLQKTT